MMFPYFRQSNPATFPRGKLLNMNVGQNAPAALKRQNRGFTPCWPGSSLPENSGITENYGESARAFPGDNLLMNNVRLVLKNDRRAAAQPASVR